MRRIWGRGRGFTRWVRIEAGPTTAQGGSDMDSRREQRLNKFNRFGGEFSMKLVPILT